MNNYVLNEESIKNFPISLIGSTEPLLGQDLSVEAFAPSFRRNVIELYLLAVANTLLNSDPALYSTGQLSSQIMIQNVLGESIEAALNYYVKEYDADLNALKNSLNYMQKSELRSDVLRDEVILSKITSTKKNNENLILYLNELLLKQKMTR